MKKILVTLLVLAMVAPAMADVAITASDAGSQQLLISFAGPANAVRGIALTLNVTGASVTSYVAASSSFNTFVDYAFNGSLDPYAIGAGHPLALETAAGVIATPIAAGTPFAVSVGYLDQTSNQLGLTSGTVVKLQLAGIPNGGSATVAISANATRGGAVVGDNLGVITVQPSQIVLGPVVVTNYNLTTATTTGGTVTTPGIGVFPYADGTVAPIVATPNATWFFWKWTGDAVANANAASTTITMNANKAVTANFTFACQQFNFTKLVSGATDNAVTVADMNLMIAWVNANKTGTTFAVSSTNPAWNPNGPIYNMTKKMGAADNAVTVADLNAFITFVNNRKTGTTFAVNCATCGC